MRKIISRYEKKKREQRNQLIIGGVLIVVMFSSVLGYAFLGRGNEDSNKIIYNGFEFIGQNGYWTLNVGDFNFAFRNNPNQVEEIDVYVKDLNNYYEKPLYLSSENNEAVSEIYMNLNQIAQRIQSACLENETCEDENLPIKNCESNFIIIKESNNSEIIQENNCVFIKGSAENLTQISDEFLFRIMKIRT